MCFLFCLEVIYVLCFSLILLSIDLTSPHVKNKMSKREFIRNTRRAINGALSDELAGHLYDNIYLIGHVARSAARANWKLDQSKMNIFLKRYTKKRKPGSINIWSLFIFFIFFSRGVLPDENFCFCLFYEKKQTNSMQCVHRIFDDFLFSVCKFLLLNKEKKHDHIKVSSPIQERPRMPTSVAWSIRQSICSSTETFSYRFELFLTINWPRFVSFKSPKIAFSIWRTASR